jgi:hypothetical protein
MPFKSDAQRRFMYAQHPRVAARWSDETPKSKDLPEKVKEGSALLDYFLSKAGSRTFVEKETGCGISNERTRDKKAVMVKKGMEELAKRANIGAVSTGQNPSNILKNYYGNVLGFGNNSGSMFRSKAPELAASAGVAKNMGLKGRGGLPAAHRMMLGKFSATDPMAMRATMQGDEQRKQEIHNQQLQFAEDKHNLELMRMQMELEQQVAQFDSQQEQQQEAAQGKMQEMTVKQEQAQAQADDKMRAMQDQEQQQIAQQVQQQQQQQMQQQQMQQQQVAAQQAMQHRGNLMKFSNVRFNQYGEPIMPASPIPAILAGTGIGGAAANYVVPTAETSKLRELAESIAPDKQTRIKYTNPVTKHKYNFLGNTEQAKKFLTNQALRANAKRLLAGLGVGALAGYGLNQYMDQSSGN